MNDFKLTSLSETLAKLAPRGRVGGLGLRSYASQAITTVDDTLPRNALYSRFVRAGHGRKRFEDDLEDQETSSPEQAVKKAPTKKKKKLAKAEQKRKREKAAKPATAGKTSTIGDADGNKAPEQNHVDGNGGRKSKKRKRTMSNGEGRVADVEVDKGKKKQQKKEKKKIKGRSEGGKDRSDKAALDDRVKKKKTVKKEIADENSGSGKTAPGAGNGVFTAGTPTPAGKVKSKSASTKRGKKTIQDAQLQKKGKKMKPSKKRSVDRAVPEPSSAATAASSTETKVRKGAQPLKRKESTSTSSVSRNKSVAAGTKDAARGTNKKKRTASRKQGVEGDKAEKKRKGGPNE